MRRKVLVIALAVILSVMVVFGTTYFSREEAVAVPVTDGVCIPALCVELPTVTLPGVTVTLPRATVRVPGPTVRLPGVTVSRIVTLPPVVRTIIVPQTVTQSVPGVPGGTVTVVRPGLPGATTTATVVVSQRIIQNGTAPPVTQEVRSTVSAPVDGQTVTTRATVTPSKEVVRLPGTTKTVTKFQAFGLSLLGLLALMGLGLFLLWLGFILGYKSSEKENTNFLRALRDTLRRKPGKHELG